MGIPEVLAGITEKSPWLVKFTEKAQVNIWNSVDCRKEREACSPGPSHIFGSVNSTPVPRLHTGGLELVKIHSPFRSEHTSKESGQHHNSFTESTVYPREVVKQAHLLKCNTAVGSCRPSLAICLSAARALVEMTALGVH
jgi:hypothetical protein